MPPTRNFFQYLPSFRYIPSTLFNIAGMMHTVADAFEKQLDSLYAEEAMDISADITVFETLLKQEGFVEEEKQEEAKK